MMNGILEYKGFTTCVEYSATDGCSYGKLEGIRSTILFDDSEKPIIEAFHEAVDEYLAYCKEFEISAI